MTLQVLLFLLALIVRAANRPADYDSDEEFINPSQPVRQPLLNRQAASSTTGLPVTGTIDQRPSRNDAWSTRMREKVQSFSSKLTLSNTLKQFLRSFVLTVVYTLECSWIVVRSTILVCVCGAMQVFSLVVIWCFPIQTQIFGFDLWLPLLRSKRANG